MQPLLKKGVLMKKVMLLMFGLVLALAVKTYAYDDHDFQVWNTDVEEFKINDKTKLAFEEEFRWGDNANQFFYHHYDGAISYSINKSWNIGGGYRHIYELKSGKFKQENSPFIIATLFWDSLGFKFDDRSRLEYRHFEYQADAWRYRNKINMKLPWKFTSLGIQPFASDEVFFAFGGSNRFSQNRLYR
jgi:hypothetical protein